MKKLASILCDCRRNIYLKSGRLICGGNDITPMPGKYPRGVEGYDQATRDIYAMYNSPVWSLEMEDI